MVRVLAIAMMLTGCGRIFGLDPPVLGDTTMTPTDAADADGPLADVMVLNDVPADVPSPAVCPNTYVTIAGSKYRLGPQNNAWANAQALCLADQVANSSLHTHLAVIASDAERAAIAPYVNGETWIGLSDRVDEGTYRWVTAEPTTYPAASGSPWGTNQPQVGTTTNCVTYSQSGGMKVGDCANNRNYACECDAYPGDPSRY